MSDVKYADGYKTSLAANTISEKVFAEVDAEGNQHVLFDEITDHRTDGKEVKQHDAFTTNLRGVQRRHKTTVDWEMLVQWKSGSTTWVTLEDMKETWEEEFGVER